ncbi:hypothetical protein BC829DRAFT_423356 [Chytridium lagenaria]|nr:hypothetical protein BC829DRAFT_423356 [Chytridium lagenaria]
MATNAGASSAPADSELTGIDHLGWDQDASIVDLLQLIAGTVKTFNTEIANLTPLTTPIGHTLQAKSNANTDLARDVAMLQKKLSVLDDSVQQCLTLLNLGLLPSNFYERILDSLKTNYLDVTTTAHRLQYNLKPAANKASKWFEEKRVNFTADFEKIRNEVDLKLIVARLSSHVNNSGPEPTLATEPRSSKSAAKAATSFSEVIPLDFTSTKDLPAVPPAHETSHIYVFDGSDKKSTSPLQAIPFHHHSSHHVTIKATSPTFGPGDNEAISLLNSTLGNITYPTNSCAPAYSGSQLYTINEELDLSSSITPSLTLSTPYQYNRFGPSTSIILTNVNMPYESSEHYVGSSSGTYSVIEGMDEGEVSFGELISSKNMFLEESGGVGNVSFMREEMIESEDGTSLMDNCEDDDDNMNFEIREGADSEILKEDVALNFGLKKMPRKMSHSEQSPLTDFEITSQETFGDTEALGEEIGTSSFIDIMNAPLETLFNPAFKPVVDSPVLHASQQYNGDIGMGQDEAATTSVKHSRSKSAESFSNQPKKKFAAEKTESTQT